ncbi:MAG: Deoxyribodipyrimidine photolyase [Sphingobacteriales bacterium]|nr:Deoxyribodipyrimidine photolyase [Sphingobacteriales bacterium]
MSEKTILVWFRKDLRIHDNEILLEAVRKSKYVVPVYCFDPRQFDTTIYQTKKTGEIRAKFLIDSIKDLQLSLQKLGGDLIVKLGKPEDVLPELVKKYQVSEVYHHREVASEETRVSADVETVLWRLKINLKHFIGHTLYHKEDLPFPIKDIPDVFTSFRKKIERDSNVRPCFETPSQIQIPPGMEPGTIPELKDLGYDFIPQSDKRGAMQFAGGETEGLKRMYYYFWDSDGIKNYKHTRNGMIGADYSSKFSPWLSLGCLSSREVYWEIKKYEKERVSNDSTYWLSFELLWRDYFRFMFKKHGNKFFQKAGFKGVAPEEAENQQELFEHWKNAKTGIPFIDANMRELNNTGFMSNRGRQNVASFLVKDLKVNWLWGAALFEEKLIDYCPASDWGNWAYVAGVGNDPKEYRHFNVLKQAHEYDPQGEYVRLWLPELNALADNQVHQPWKLSSSELKALNIELGNTYPKPIIELAK